VKIVLDLSHYQGGDVGYLDVKNDHQNIDGVILKVGQGATYVDPDFQKNLAGFKAVGLPVGGYFFYDPLVDPVVQATNFYNQIKDAKLDLVPVIDVEQAKGWNTLAIEKISEDLQAFCDFIQEKMNVVPMIYTGPAFIKQYLGAFPLGYYRLWLAEYTIETPIGFNWVMWQHTSGGKVDGIVSNVDMSYLKSDDLTPILMTA